MLPFRLPGHHRAPSVINITLLRRLHFSRDRYQKKLNLPDELNLVSWVIYLFAFLSSCHTAKSYQIIICRKQRSHMWLHIKAHLESDEILIHDNIWTKHQHFLFCYSFLNSSRTHCQWPLTDFIPYFQETNKPKIKVRWKSCWRHKFNFQLPYG